MTVTTTARWTPGEAHPHRRAILGVLCLSLLIVVIDNTVLNTALPTLAKNLHATTTGLQWITDAYTLVFAAALITAGSLGDRHGRRRALLGGLAVFAAGSIGAALSGGPDTLIAFRAVMGLGGAFVMPATLSILSGVFPAEERAGAIGAWSAVAGVAIVIGPTMGGFLLDHFAWGSVFWVNVPLSVVAALAVLRVVPELTTEERRPLDLAGVGLITAGLLGLVDAVIEAPDRGWLSPLTLGELALAAVALGAFVVHELRTRYPMFDVRVFANRAFSGAAGAVALTFFALFGTLFALTQYLQLVHGYSPLAAGVRALPFAAAMGALSPLSAVVARRLGSGPVITGGLALMGTGVALLSFAGTTTPYLDLIGPVVVMGTGMGLVMAPASEVIMTSVPAAKAGVASAVNDTVREVGGALGVAVIGTLVSAGFRSHLHTVGLPAPAAATARSSVAAAEAVAAHAGTRGPALLASSHQAFTEAMTQGFRVAAAVAIAGAVATAIVLPRRVGGRNTTASMPAPVPAAA